MTAGDHFDYPQDARRTDPPTSPYLRLPAVCPSCPHPVREHSREPGVGCLHEEPHWSGPLCPCTEPGDSPADQ